MLVLREMAEDIFLPEIFDANGRIGHGGEKRSAVK
jgi:hypothetical protein